MLIGVCSLCWKECIVETKERGGVSRTTIKKVCRLWWSVRVSSTFLQYIKDHHGLDMTAAMNLSHFNRAITNGAEDGTFALPKGPSGKVKLAPKTKPAPTNEVCYT